MIDSVGDATQDDLREAEPRIGPKVADHPALRPGRGVMAGRLIRLEPLDPARHGDDLWAELHGPGQERVWRYLFEGPFADRAAFDAHLARKAALDDPLFFAVVDQTSGRALGYQTLMRVDIDHRVIEIGNIAYGSSLQRTAAATEAQYLMARHVFEELGYRRYEWKCNALNAPSRRAAERLGFSFEGIFRQHLIVKGRNRDTAWYSMLDSEWLACKGAFEAWLDPANFDARGRQIEGLAQIRRRLTP